MGTNIASNYFTWLHCLYCHCASPLHFTLLCCLFLCWIFAILFSFLRATFRSHSRIIDLYGHQCATIADVKINTTAYIQSYSKNFCDTITSIRFLIFLLVWTTCVYACRLSLSHTRALFRMAKVIFTLMSRTIWWDDANEGTKRQTQTCAYTHEWYEMTCPK